MAPESVDGRCNGMGRQAPRLALAEGQPWALPSEDAVPDHRHLLQTWSLVVPAESAFTHLTAARHLGWWLPPLPADLPVFVAVAEASPRPRRQGLRASRHPTVPSWQVFDGVRTTTAAETLLACARDLELLDMVVLIDAALAAGHCSFDDVARVANSGRRGAPMLRKALRHADSRSESAWETMLRMLHVAADIPVEPQVEISDETGAFLARGDLHILGTRTLHEYDGSHHLDRRNQRDDLRRMRRLSREGWTRHGYTSHEVLHEAVGIVRDGDLALRRPHRPERVRAWHAQLSRSLFSASGTALFRQGIGLDTPGGAPTGRDRPSAPLLDDR